MKRPENSMKKWLPWILVAVFAGWVLSAFRPPKDKDFAFTEFGRLPLMFNGRLQPMDSLARNSLLQLREKQSVYLKDEKRSMPAIEWLAEVTMAPERADVRKVFRVDHPELKSMLNLPEKDAAGREDGKHYSWNQIQPGLDLMDKESKRIGAIEASHRTPFEQAVMKMHARLVLYMRLKNTLQPQDAQDWAAELAEYERLIEPGVAAARAQRAGREYDEAVFNRFLGFAQRFDAMARFEPPLVVPPHAHPGHDHGDWMRMGAVLLETARGERMPEWARSYAAMATAFKQGRPDEFNRAVADYRASLEPGFARALAKAGREDVFNRFQPFYHALAIYVVAFVLCCVFWFNLSEPVRRSALCLVGLAFVVHTAGLIFRMALEGRPPVTNLYSSAIFIGWGAVVLGLVLERFFRNAIGLVVAAAVGFSTLIIAHNLSLGGDTMEMMRAVLDTNFWLATHVVIITLGYASTFVGGFLAIIYIVLGVFTRRLSTALAPDSATGVGIAVGVLAGGVAGAVAGGLVARKSAKLGETFGRSLSRMVYGIICFATLFSFVGTVLGGIWADQSWGRFWGWDPKENGALIIVLWNALVLHARWGKLVQERGLMNLVVFGNIVTSWSWFGTNMLGIGLHSYGFMDAAFKWLMAFVASQLLIIALGLLPARYWASFRNRPPAPPPDKPARRGKASPKLAPA